MVLDISEERVRRIGKVLVDPKRPLKERFRALFTLRNIGGKTSIDCIVACFGDPSALLKHECAYCLGQMQDTYAIPYLIGVLKDKSQEPMVRHEAGEALGAIGSPETVPVLKEFCEDSVIEVAETCQLAVQRIELNQDPNSKEDINSPSPYASVDPAPPLKTLQDVPALREILLDDAKPLFERYRAMFALRNVGNRDSVLALAEGLKCGSALFRHEIAYVLGQIQHEASVPQLTETLRDIRENEMVRHECAEALGSIATKDCMDILKHYLADEKRVVSESCIVALDMCEYENSEEFQYADTLTRISEQ